mgnify:CR=1 FL=1
MRPRTIAERILPDGRELVVYPMLYGKARLYVGEQEEPGADATY